MRATNVVKPSKQEKKMLSEIYLNVLQSNNGKDLSRT